MGFDGRLHIMRKESSARVRGAGGNVYVSALGPGHVPLQSDML